MTAVPTPLALLAVGLGSFSLGMAELGWVPVAQEHDAALVLLALVAPLQLLATILLFVDGERGQATGLGLAGGGWAVVGVVLITSPPGSHSAALGVFLLAVAFELALVVVLSRGIPMAGEAVLSALALRFAATGVFQVTGSHGWKHVAGAFGLALALVAVVDASLLLRNDTATGDG
jgi:succinate-acetate transporter protein